MSLRGSPGRREDKRRGLPQSAEINVTSLIDVAFTLLVIFIITAPVLQGGLEVDLPEAEVEPVTQRDDPFFVSIDSDDEIYIAETPIPRDEFRDRLRELLEAGEAEVVYIRADREAQHGTVGPIIAATNTVARELGVRWALVMEDEWER